MLEIPDPEPTPKRPISPDPSHVRRTKFQKVAAGSKTIPMVQEPSPSVVTTRTPSSVAAGMESDVSEQSEKKLDEKPKPPRRSLPKCFQKPFFIEVPPEDAAEAKEEEKVLRCEGVSMEGGNRSQQSTCSR